MSEGVLAMYVIYERPRDYPEQYVVRIHRVSRGGTAPDERAYCLGPTLADVRAALPEGLFNLGRQPDDEPQIVEVWV